MRIIILTLLNLFLGFAAVSARADDFLLTDTNIYLATKDICHWYTSDVISLLSDDEKLNIIRGQKLAGTKNFEKMLDLVRQQSFEKSFRNFQYSSSTETTQFILNNHGFLKALDECYGNDSEARGLIISKVYSADYIQKSYSAFLHIALGSASRKILTHAFEKNKAAFYSVLAGLLSYYGWTIYDNRKTLNQLIAESSQSQTTANTDVANNQELAKRYKKLYAFNLSQIRLLEHEASLFKNSASPMKLKILDKIESLKKINQTILLKSNYLPLNLPTKAGAYEK